MRFDDDRPDEEAIGSRDLAEWRSAPGRRLAQTAVRLAAFAAEQWVLLVTAGIGLVLVVGLTGLSAGVYEEVVEGDGVAGLDQPVLDQAIAWRTPGLDSVVTHFTDVGGTRGMPILAVLATVLMAVLWRSRTPLVLMAIAAAGSLAMTTTGKQFLDRARPPQSMAVPPYEVSPSFPSGHTLNATVITGIVVYLVLRRLSSARARAAVVTAGLVFVLAMGLSRVFLGHHWLTDVIAGWLLGLAWLAVVVTAHRLYLTVRRHRRSAQTSSLTQDSPSRTNPSRS